MTKKYQLSISGMGCMGCANTVESALRDLEGVSAATVNFAEKTAQVEADVSVADLISAVRNAGYDAAEAGDGEET